MNGVAKLFEKIKSVSSRKSADVWPDYKRLLASVANDLEFEPDEAVHILEAAKKSQEDFAVDVQVMRRRIDAKQRCVDASKVAKELPMAESELANAVAQFEAVKEHWHSKIANLDAQVSALRGRSIEFGMLRDVLRTTCLNKNLLDELEQARFETREPNEKRVNLMSLVESIQAQLRHAGEAKARFEKLGGTAVEVEENASAFARLNRDLKDAQRELNQAISDCEQAHRRAMKAEQAIIDD